MRTHSITQHILNLIKKKQSIDLNFPVHLHNTEYIPVLIANSDKKIESVSKSTHLLTSLLHQVDFSYWEKYVDEKIFDNPNGLLKALNVSLAYQDSRFMEKILKVSTQVLSSHINGDNSQETLFRISQMKNLFSNHISKEFPFLIGDKYVIMNDKYSYKDDNFYEKFHDLNTISQCLFGSFLTHSENYAKYPLDLDSILLQEDFISAFKKQVQVVTNKPFHAYSFVDKVFDESIGPSIESSFLMNLHFSGFSSKSSAIIHHPQHREAILKTMTSFVDYIHSGKILVTNDSFSEIFRRIIYFQSEELSNNLYKLRKQSPDNKANTYSLALIAALSHKTDKGYGKPQLWTRDGKNSDFEVNVPIIDFTLNLLNNEPMKETILSKIKSPYVLLLSNQFEEYCQTQDFIVQIEKYKKSKPFSKHIIDSSQSVVTSILLFQLLEKFEPTLFKKLSKKINLKTYNLDKMLSMSNLTTENFKPVAKILLDDVNSNNFAKFLEKNYSSLPNETIQSILLEASVPQSTNKRSTLKF